MTDSFAKDTAAGEIPGPDPAHVSALPSRRERLRVLMRLKSQRQLLLVSLAIAAAAAAILATLIVRDRMADEIVPLGKGLASVETMPVAQITESSLNGGEASYYGGGDGFAGRQTASGEIFDPQKLTAAHRTLPMGSRVRVTNPANDQSVIVRINDRGPFHGNRVIDLSYAAASQIGLIKRGKGDVQLALIS